MSVHMAAIRTRLVNSVARLHKVVIVYHELLHYYGTVLIEMGLTHVTFHKYNYY